jgi:thioesterase domain-containing protein
MGAAQLFTAIERLLGRSVPLAALFHSPTPRKLAAWIAGNHATDAWRPLVAIKPEGHNHPLFLIHGAEGNVLLYRALASHLGPDQPVYGLQAAGLDGSPLGNTDFEAVAQRYIEEIRTVQPHGPYRLGGYCLGGSIALEMAQQLLTAGEPVELVAMLENYHVHAIGWPLPLPKRMANTFLNVYYHFLNVVEAPRGTRLAFVREKSRVEMLRTRIACRHWTGKLLGVFGFSMASWHQNHLKVRDAYDAAFERYKVRPYPGKISLFLPRRRLAGFHDPLAGWAGVARDGTEVFTLSANPRGSLVEPHVRELAGALQQSLKEKENGAGAQSHAVISPDRNGKTRYLDPISFPRA